MATESVAQDLPGTHERPTIGICSRPNDDATQAYVQVNYTRRVFQAGGIPVMLPFGFALAPYASQIVDRIDGLLLTGGEDVSPDSFGGSPYAKGCSARLMGLSPDRDIFEWNAARAAWDKNLPTLGICRGVQVMNVSFGGTLVRDVQEQDREGILQHMRLDSPNTPVHGLTVDPESRLAQILGTTELEVNSLHHEAIHTPAPGGRIVAWASDGTPEGLEFPEKGFFLGVQWHPEMLGTTPQLFEAFVSAALTRRRLRR